MENLGYIGAHPRQFSNDICFVLYVWGAIFQINLSTLKSSCSNEIILHRNTYWFVFDKDIDTEDVFMYIYLLCRILQTFVTQHIFSFLTSNHYSFRDIVCVYKRENVNSKVKGNTVVAYS